MTYTYAILEVSETAYAEIRARLAEAGYTHAFHRDADGTEVIDMHGIALQSMPGEQVAEAFHSRGAVHAI